jgi:apolipoprotein N-acyltransferase
VIGLALFVATVRFIVQHRSDETTRQAASTGVWIALAVGVLGFIQWVTQGQTPALAYALLSIVLLYMSPAFVISFYISLAWRRRSKTPSDGH